MISGQGLYFVEISQILIYRGSRPYFVEIPGVLWNRAKGPTMLRISIYWFIGPEALLHWDSQGIVISSQRPYFVLIFYILMLEALLHWESWGMMISDQRPCFVEITQILLYWGSRPYFIYASRMTSNYHDLTDRRVDALFMRCLLLWLQYHDGADDYDYEKSWCGARQCIWVSQTLVVPLCLGDSISDGGTPRVLPYELGWGRSYILMVSLWGGFMHLHSYASSSPA